MPKTSELTPAASMLSTERVVATNTAGETVSVLASGMPVSDAQAADATAKVATHAALTSTHGSTALATPSRIAERDAAGAAAFGGLDLDTVTIATAFKAGRARWNDTVKCWEIDLESGTTLQVGQENLRRVRNSSGSAIANGVAVYINGATGSLPTIALAQANNLTIASRTIGLVTTEPSISNNGNGFVCISGTVNGLNTTAYADGDVLYLRDDVAGGVSTTAPTAEGSAVVVVGIVIRSHVTLGAILVRTQYLGSVTGYGVLNATSKANARTAIDAAAADLSNAEAQAALALHHNSLVTLRDPLLTDNSAVGYSVSSNWQHDGQIWVPVYSGADSAAWGVVQGVGARISDLLGATGVFAGGTIAMKAGYTGAAIDISCVIATVTTTATINILASGELDVETLQSYLGRIDAGTNVAVTKLYDQTGNGNHLTKNVARGAPNLVFDPALQRYCLVGSTRLADGYSLSLEIPGTVSVNGNNLGVWAVGRGVLTAENANGVICAFGDYTGPGTHTYVWQGDPLGSVAKWSTDNGGRMPTPKIAYDVGPSVSSLISAGAAGTTWGVNDTSSTNAAVPTSRVYTGGWLGYDHIQDRFMSHRLIGFAVANAAPSAATQAAIRRGFYKILNIAPQIRDQVVFLGDSRQAAYQSRDISAIALFASQQLKIPARCYNLGNGSQTALGVITTTAVTAASSLYQATNQNVAVVGPLGVNDYIVNAASAATTHGYLTTICTNLRAAGYRVVLLTGDSANNAGQKAFLAALRTAILATPEMADEIVDVAGYAPVADTGNVAYYPDGLHWSAALNKLVADALTPAIERQLVR